ncbi:hypothetical protein I79_009912 [Cricetulus griseus]|uniref:Uncharacterized protein n=1 Tax=Cricetulus griseus TaxID=10029 RepID=G3HH17_CRIGR|nr:hypothetical protein I79_009912 [Cricetulus griseus]
MDREARAQTDSIHFCDPTALAKCLSQDLKSGALSSLRGDTTHAHLLPSFKKKSDVVAKNLSRKLCHLATADSSARKTPGAS